MSKESFTIENIKTDLKNIHKFKFDDFIIGVFIIGTLFIIIPMFIYIFYSLKHPIIPLAIAISAALHLIVHAVYDVIKSKKAINAINNGEFNITAAFLQGKKKEIHNSKLLINKPYKLFFSDGSICNMYRGDVFYKWSKSGEIKSESIYKIADIPDKFYLARINKSQHIVCYPAKLFEPSGFTVDESHISEYLDSKSPE